ncbi:MAG: MBL fold metallo-hydrolase [Prevotella sp.]|nr:MBL fold metallo-hydrolase [Prevotella sp.]MBR1840425.1 MBL fold metallo-hydrolase [Prevotella sp.]
MINIKTIQCNLLSENCYIVSDETKECMIVDCGAVGSAEEQYIKDYISEKGLTPKLHVLTHGHFDHVMGAKFIYETYGLQPVISEQDAELYKDFKGDAESVGYVVDYTLPVIGRCVNDGDEVKFGNHTFRVIHTPGHSRGCVVYYCEEEEIAFTGDTLFRGSIGRTDLPGGSMFQIIQSLRMLTQLPDTTQVYPGHGRETSIGYELASNPYLDR